jgi:hypothetical protein
MSISELNMIFAAGEIGLLLLVLVLALVARWVGKRETAREIAALPVYQPKLHGIEGPATLAAAQFAAAAVDTTSRQMVRKLDSASEKERVETAAV